MAPLSPVEQKQAYLNLQAGGEAPLQGFRKPAPEKPKGKFTSRCFNGAAKICFWVHSVFGSASNGRSVILKFILFAVEILILIGLT